MAEAASTVSLDAHSLCGSYCPPEGGYDEMCAADGGLRSHWVYLAEVLESLGPAGLQGRWRESRRLIRDNGVTYNIYGDPQGMSRPWELDLIPLLLKSDEWAGIERGLMQRAELLNRILLDLYGPRRLLRSGLLPPELVLGRAGLLLPCVGIKAARDRPLVFHSIDLTRMPDGKLRVVGDRTQAPAGAGYALENRLVLSRVMPSLFRDSHVHRLAGFFRTLRTTLRALTPRSGDSMRIVLLTPGPSIAAYFEHAYLANYLGYTLAQGDDLTVRDGALWLKTLNGLERVDVVLRRVEDAWCDPLELRGDSLMGVPGLLQAVRAGNVTLANALGSCVLEHPGLGAFLPEICKELLGEELHLTGVQTWWCGVRAHRRYVLSHLDRLVIKRLSSDGKQSLYGPSLSQAELDELRAAIRATPNAYVGQEVVPYSTAPVLTDDHLEPRAALLRTFLVAEDEGYAVMPGGLTRVAPDRGGLFVSSRLGGIGKDTWVLASEPEREESLIGAVTAYRPAVRVTSEVSSRVADNLYWIGRYAERAENLVRLLRAIVLRFGERIGGGAREFHQVRCLRLLLQALTHQTLTYPGFVGEEAEERLTDPEPELMSLITEVQRVGGLPQTLQSLGLAAWSVRDRLSMDTWRVVSAIDDKFHALTETLPKALEEALDELDPLITELVAFTGLTRENMTHNEGWQFLELGRRLERAVNTNTLLRSTLVPYSGELAEGMLAESVLGVTDSLITYRRRYQSGTRVGALLDLVFQDELNPRSLAFQIAQLEELVTSLPKEQIAAGRTQAEKLALEAMTLVRLADLDALASVGEGEDERATLEEVLARIDELLPQLSDDITALYFRHEDRPHSLLARRG
jgi:uncharacterized circularly permuted ATP-grasp superfamily protein/uncharacterized alpha-E superfamily protein